MLIRFAPRALRGRGRHPSPQQAPGL